MLFLHGQREKTSNLLFLEGGFSEIYFCCFVVSEDAEILASWAE